MNNDSKKSEVVRVRRLEAARIVGDLLREDRRAADRAMADELAASEEEFNRWTNRDWDGTKTDK